jgi:hypothetical protein
MANAKSLRIRNWLQALVRRDRVLAAVLICVCAAAYTAAIRLRLAGGSPAGDEPAYLVISQTVQKYHSLDVMRDYVNRDYVSFYNADLMPHIVSAPNGKVIPLHGIGGPLLWLVPYMLWGRMGAMGFMAVISTLTVVNVYFFLRERAIATRYAYLTAMILAVGSPIYVYASMSFIEPLGALPVIFAVRAVLIPGLHPARLVVASAGLALLPWIHTRFALFTAILGALLLIRIYRESGWRRWGRYVQCAAPLVISGILLEVFSITAWGSTNPGMNTTTVFAHAKRNSVPAGAMGLFFEQHVGLIVNFPIFALLLPGVMFACARRWRGGQAVVLLTVVPYLAMVVVLDWKGGYSPPARYATAVAPLLAWYVALTLQQIRAWYLTFLAVILGAVGYAFALITDIHPNDRFAFPGADNKGMRRFGDLIGVQFTHSLPNYRLPGYDGELLRNWTAGTIAFGMTLVIAGVIRGFHRPSTVGSGAADPASPGGAARSALCENRPASQSPARGMADISTAGTDVKPLLNQRLEGLTPATGTPEQTVPAGAPAVVDRPARYGHACISTDQQLSSGGRSAESAATLARPDAGGEDG